MPVTMMTIVTVIFYCIYIFSKTSHNKRFIVTIDTLT